jgi:hypothetical protein
VPFSLPQEAGFRLLGHLISPNPPSLVTVRDFLLQAWKFAAPFTVDLIPGDRFLFTVSSDVLVAKIIENGPWNVKGALLVIKPWPPELSIDEVDLSSCAFWVQVHGLPLQNLTAVNAIKIGKFLGIEVLNVENGDLEGIIAHHHLRIRVLINVLQPLIPGFSLPRLDLPSIWIRFQYERLADYCVYCGLIGHRKFFHHFHPISLCNIIYKIISKILANRLKPLLSKFISPFQTAFVPGCHIQDNSILSHEMFHSLKSKRGRGGLMAVNIDMEKAFDKMEWEFLLTIMEKLGFKPQWINWIILCITTSSFSFLLNGSPFGLFRPSKGLRQGDPLSPFLFILGTEVISRLLHHNLQGYKVARGCIPLTHLLFADDLIIFTQASSLQVGIIKECLAKYSLWSGQSVNMGKSNILFSPNTTSSTKASILDIIPYSETPISAKHLGLPMFFGRSKQNSFMDILDKVHNKIEGWRAKSLSQAGKSVLLKVVASTIPSYAMSSFLFPEILCHRLDTAFKNFWWVFPKGKTHNLSLKSWSSLCLPKDQGGMGFRLMKDINISLITKLGWKILSNHDCLWVSLFKEKYIKYGSLISCPLGLGSYVWNGIKSIVPLLKLGSCYAPHISSSLTIWFSPWIPTMVNFVPTPRRPCLVAQYPLAISDLFCPVSLTWNVSFLQFLFDSLSVIEIMRIKIRSGSDALLWTVSSLGCFSTKSAHHLFTALRPIHPSPVLASTWKGLWKLKLNFRLKLFLWKVVWNIVPTKSRISLVIQSGLDTSCSLCSTTSDSLMHLFFSCPIARVIWRNSFWPLDISALPIASMADWLLIILHPEKIGIPLVDTHFFQIFAVIACDQIWYSRNKALHEGLIPNALSISRSVNQISKIHLSAWSTHSPSLKEVWKKPDPDCFKINYDTAIRSTFSAQSAVCRDSNGFIVKSITQIRPPCVALYGEASAALLAAQLCSYLGLSHVIFEGDSLTVNLAINNPLITQDWRISSAISDFISTIPSSTCWFASSVNRSANFCAHHVAYWAATRFASNCIPNFSTLLVSGTVLVTTRFFFFFIQNVKRVIAVARLRVAQPTYGTCPITCT